MIGYDVMRYGRLERVQATEMSDCGSSSDEEGQIVVTRSMEHVARELLGDTDYNAAHDTFMARIAADSADTLAIREMEQRSERWLQIRSHRITGSVCGDWMGYNRFSSQRNAIKRLLHRTKVAPNEHMRRGTALEPVARDMFLQYMRAQHPDWKVECVEDGLCVVDDPDMYCFGYSPDGRVIITDEHGVTRQQLLEIKAPFKGFYDGIPPGYMAQMQMGMELLSKIFDADGFTHCYFVQIHEGVLKTEVVSYDKAYATHMMTELRRLWLEEYVPRVILKQHGHIRDNEIDVCVDCDQQAPRLKSSLKMYQQPMKRRRIQVVLNQ